MFALVEIAGQQFEVALNKQINVPYLSGETGDKLEFDKISLISQNENVQIGEPYLNGTVSATIVEHGRNDKILVFHKKRRKGYRKLNGYRSKFTRIKIENIKA